MLEFELEHELELEGEAEGEAFLRTLAGLARRAAASPALRRVAAQGARAALSGLAAEYEGEFEGEWEAEGEWELNPARRVYPDALMEHLAHAAAETESEAEAEAFIGALVPLAARILPRVAPTLIRAAPRLIRGVTRITRVLRRSPRTRQLVRTLPRIVRQTARTMARQQAGGRPVTPRQAVRTLARQTQRVLSSPRQCVAAVRRSQAVDQRYHRAMGGRPSPVLGVGRPVGSRVIGGVRPVRMRRLGVGGVCPTCGSSRSAIRPCFLDVSRR